MSTDKPLPARISPDRPAASLVDWCAGGALGMLLGLLVGLSASPVVAGVVTGLVALLAGVFGLSDKLSDGLGRRGAHRLAAFGVIAALAAPLGIYLRSAELLSPTVAQQRQQLVEIGITDPAEQKDTLRFLRFGLLPAGVAAVGKDGEGARQSMAARQGVLYAASADWCAALRRLVTESAPASDLLTLLRTGPETARQAVNAVKAMPGAEQSHTARAALLYLCAP